MRFPVSALHVCSRYWEFVYEGHKFAEVVSTADCLLTEILADIRRLLKQREYGDSRTMPAGPFSGFLTVFAAR